MSEDLKLSAVFVDFLKHQDFKAFSKNLKNVATRSAIPSMHKELYTATGNHEIDTSKHMRSFSDKLPLYTTMYESTASRLHQLSRKLADQYKDISTTIDEISDCAKTVHQIYKLSDNAQFSKLYKDIEITLKSWSKINSDIANV